MKLPPPLWHHHLTQNSAAVKELLLPPSLALVIKESDNNVKLIVIAWTLNERSMAMSSTVPTRKCAERRSASLQASQTSSRNVEKVVVFLKKQLQKTQEADFEKAPEYRQSFIQSFHVTAIKSQKILQASVMHALMGFLGDASNPSVVDVVSFVREVVEKFHHLRATICEKLIFALSEIKSAKVFGGCLWLLGEYVEFMSDI